MKRHGKNTVETALRKRGLALLIVLMFIALLSVIVTEFCYETQVEASYATNQGSSLDAFLAAKSGIAQGISLLQQDFINEQLDGMTPIDCRMDVWYSQPGQANVATLNNAQMRTTVSDEYGKINLNALLNREQDPPVKNEQAIETLVQFFILRLDNDEERSRSVVDCIVDWLDYGDDDQQETDGAENEYYTGLAENPFNCKNGPMDSIEELLLIKGITPEIYFGNPQAETAPLPLSEYLTVNGDWRGRVNINTAEPETIAAVLAGAQGGDVFAALEQAMAMYDEVTAQPYEQAPTAGQGMGNYNPANTNANTNRNVTPGLNNKDDNKAGISGVNQNNPFGSQNQNNLNNPNNPNNMYGQTSTGGFITSSACFRIYGDGKQEEDNVKIRIEAFVFRRPENPELMMGGGMNMNMNQPVAPTNPTNPTTNPAGMAVGQNGEDQTMPQEPYRIISYRVLQ